MTGKHIVGFDLAARLLHFLVPKLRLLEYLDLLPISFFSDELEVNEAKFCLDPSLKV